MGPRWAWLAVLLLGVATLWVVTGAWLYLLMAPVFVALAWYRYR